MKANKRLELMLIENVLPLGYVIIVVYLVFFNIMQFFRMPISAKGIIRAFKLKTLIFALFLRLLPPFRVQCVWHGKKVVRDEKGSCTLKTPMNSLQA